MSLLVYGGQYNIGYKLNQHTTFRCICQHRKVRGYDTVLYQRKTFIGYFQRFYLFTAIQKAFWTEVNRI